VSCVSRPSINVVSCRVNHLPPPLHFISAFLQREDSYLSIQPKHLVTNELGEINQSHTHTHNTAQHSTTQHSTHKIKSKSKKYNLQPSARARAGYHNTAAIIVIVVIIISSDSSRFPLVVTSGTAPACHTKPNPKPGCTVRTSIRCSQPSCANLVGCFRRRRRHCIIIIIPRPLPSS